MQCCQLLEANLSLKKILNILIFLLVFGIVGCQFCCAETELEAKKRETREQINRLKWLESVETNKLYKNQQKLENANNDFNNKYGSVSIFILLGAIFISLGVIITIVSILRG